MAKSTKADLVSVLLSCSYSGHPNDPGPGGIIEVDADEAAHIVNSGGGVIVEAEAKDEPQA